MYLYMITAENTMIQQCSLFILQDAIHSTVTIQNKGTTTHRTMYCTLHADDAIYSTLNTQSGPVHLSCPPECHRLSVAADRLAASYGYLKNMSRVIYYTWAAAGHCAVVIHYYERPFAVPVAKCAMKAPVQSRCWWDRTARPVQNVN